MDSTSIPFSVQPVDQLRAGLASKKEETKIRHPVETITREGINDARNHLQEQVYGTALTARAQIERQLLDRVERLPGLPSSKLGLESLSGKLDKFDYESFIPSMDERNAVVVDLHAKMENKLGLQ